MNGNLFELTGRVNYIKFDYAKTGNAYCRVLMSKKSNRENEYNTFPVVFFGPNAEAFAKNVDKGDTVNVKGMLSSEEDTTTKTITPLLIGLEAITVVYDESARQYVPKKGTAKVASKPEGQGELPWKS
jgi:primosomal replication protein N